MASVPIFRRSWPSGTSRVPLGVEGDKRLAMSRYLHVGPAGIRKVLERATGFEPATTCLGSRNSTTELHPLRYDSIILAHPHACQEGTR